MVIYPYDIFKCTKLHENVTYSRCVRNQKEAIGYFGEDAGKYNSCPCEKGIEIKRQMGGEIIMRGTCDNCKRPDMAVQKRGSWGVLCASCGAAIAGMGPADAAKALAEKKESFSGKGKMTAGRVRVAKATETKVEPHELKELGKAGAIVSKVLDKAIHPEKPAASILVCFNNGDENLLARLNEEAKRNRRDPDQHILFLIEQAITTGGQYDTDRP